MASDAMAMALMPCCGAAPAWAARPVDLDLQAIAASGGDGDAIGRAAIPIERQLRLAQQGQLRVVGPVQPDLFLDRKKEGQRRVRQPAA